MRKTGTINYPNSEVKRLGAIYFNNRDIMDANFIKYAVGLYINAKHDITTEEQIYSLFEYMIKEMVCIRGGSSPLSSIPMMALLDLRFTNYKGYKIVSDNIREITNITITPYKLRQMERRFCINVVSSAIRNSQKQI